jgi:anaerobic ribonucleoside-triphosphate reductase
MRKLPQIRTTQKLQITKKNKKGEEKEMQTAANTQRTPCEVFSRSMGFIRPVSNFNIGKYSEFCERKTFTEKNSLSAGARHAELLKMAA